VPELDRQAATVTILFDRTDGRQATYKYGVGSWFCPEGAKCTIDKIEVPDAAELQRRLEAKDREIERLKAEYKNLVDGVVDLLVTLEAGPVAFSPAGCFGDQAHFRISAKVEQAAADVKTRLPSDAEYRSMADLSQTEGESR
jgi:hypothetical protein